MAYSVSKLVSRAFYLSGVVSRELQTVSGSQLSNGVDLLNSLLDVQSANAQLIPYYKVHPLQLLAGEGEYFVPNLYDISSFTFNIGAVRFASQKTGRNDFFSTSRVDGITALPYSWNWMREKGGTRLRLYYLPMSDCMSQIVGKFGLTDVSKSTDLETVYDNFYIEFLRYALAQYICDDYDIEFPPTKVAHLNKIANSLKKLSAPDLSMVKTGIISNGRRLGLTWAQANIGRGFVPI